MNTGSSFQLTRYAPTPSGFLHLGNLYSFVLTALLAQRYGAKILLRMDDLDRERLQDDYVQDIFDTLNFMELPWHMGPRDMADYKAQYSQVHRMPLYTAALDHLRAQGQVYACTCSRAQIFKAHEQGIYQGTCKDAGLSLDTEGLTWRIITEGVSSISMRTVPDGRVEETFPAYMRDFVIRKRNGYPAYQLSSVVDDIHFGVDLVVRGQDLLESTIAQLFLASKLPANNFPDTAFYHHALMHDNGGEKLSKSAGATSIQYLRNHGHNPSNIYTLLAKMIGIPEPVANWQGFEPWVTLP